MNNERSWRKKSREKVKLTTKNPVRIPQKEEVATLELQRVIEAIDPLHPAEAVNLGIDHRQRTVLKERVVDQTVQTISSTEVVDPPHLTEAVKLEIDQGQVMIVLQRVIDHTAQTILLTEAIDPQHPP